MFKVFIVAEHGEVLTENGCAYVYQEMFGRDAKAEVAFIMGSRYNYINTFRYKIKEAYAICVATYDGMYTNYEFINQEEIPAFREFSKPYRRSGETSYQVCKKYLNMKKQMEQT